MKGRLVEADSLEETVIFGQGSNSEDTEVDLYKRERPSQTGELRGNTDSVMETNYSSPHSREVLEPAETQFDTLHSVAAEPASLTFRTPTAQGISNPLEFLRLKMPSLNFGKKTARPVGYTHLKEITGASNHHAWDTRVEKDAGTNASEDPNLTYPQDGGHETYTDYDNNDNLPGSSIRPSQN